ncbi:MAG: immunity protein Imm33 domain-containing protein [Thermoanaerobaculia bacterium]
MENLVDVCPHVDRGERSIAWALREEPVCETDSGWRLLCAAKEVGKIGTDVSWTIARLLREEPGLEPHLEQPVGTILQREEGVATWRKWR